MAKTGLPNFSLKYTGPWRGIEHVWSVDSSHSGSALTTEASVITLLNAIHAVIVAFCDTSYGSDTPGMYLTGWSYYNGTTAAALWEKEYTTKALSLDDGFTQTYGAGLTTGGNPLPPEACVLLVAPVGSSSTGKPVSLRKYVHYTGGGGEAPSLASGAAAIAAQLGNGDLPGSRVLTSPGGKQGPWSVYPYFSNHQMLRRRKKKALSSSSSSGLLHLLEQTLQGKGLITTIEELAEGI